MKRVILEIPAFDSKLNNVFPFTNASLSSVTLIHINITMNYVEYFTKRVCLITYFRVCFYYLFSIFVPDYD
jgi:hypothetical protein